MISHKSYLKPSLGYSRIKTDRAKITALSVDLTFSYSFSETESFEKDIVKLSSKRWANGSGKLQDVPRFASAVEGHKSGILAAEVITGIDLSDHYLSFEGNFGEKISARSFSLSTGINYQDMIDFSITYTSSGKLGKGSMC